MIGVSQGKPQIITTPWGSRQVQVDGLPMLTREEEIALRQEWRTPAKLFDRLNEEFCFQLDAAASDENHLARMFIDKNVDALSVVWLGSSLRRICIDTRGGEEAPRETLRAFCNPGFGNMGPWIEKSVIEAARSPSAIVVVLGLCAPSTEWWAFATERASEIRLLSPRPQYVSPDPRIHQTSNPREGAAFVFRGSAPARGARIETWRWDR